MKIIEPSFEILHIPEGEWALSFLEKIGRVAYKSEDKITEGVRCAECARGEPFVETSMGVAACNYLGCGACNGTGWTKEPSSHRFIRMILKAEQEAKLVRIAQQYLSSKYSDSLEGFCLDDVAPLVRHILEHIEENPPHESVIEHCHATVRFLNNRGFTHEQVRHRIASYTQTSTRYCNYSKNKFGREITITPNRTDEELCGQREVWEHTIKTTEAAYMKLTEAGVSPQIARDLLPHNLLADIVVTANFREWNHIFRLRGALAAHPDMRMLMGPLREAFQRRVPIIFDKR